MQFDELVALVTGGATGIGFATVRALLRRETRVVVDSRSPEKLAAARERLVDEGFAESQFMTVSADVTDSEAVAGMFARVRDEWGPVMALVNNAAVSGGRKELAEIPDEDWDRMIRANLRGVFLCTKAALPSMYEHRWGRVVNISSAVGLSGKFPGSPHYSATKGGIIAFTKKVAVEAAAHNVAINCVAPGLIADTGFTHYIKGELLQRYLSLIPANRPGTPEEVGELVAFLCSEHAGYIVGQVIAIDGGAVA